MVIELRGIMKKSDKEHHYVDVLVTVDRPDIYRRHRVGVDIDFNRGRIRRFLSELYGVPPGQIVWPEHIRPEGLG